jgi:hypothetical protein
MVMEDTPVNAPGMQPQSVMACCIYSHVLKVTEPSAHLNMPKSSFWSCLELSWLVEASTRVQLEFLDHGVPSSPIDRTQFDRWGGEF